MSGKKTVSAGSVTSPINEVRLILPPGLEPDRRSIQDDFIGAQMRIWRFAEKHGWNGYWDHFVDHAEIYDDKRKFDAAVLKLDGQIPGVPLPKAFSACLERGIFLGVSPGLYSLNYPDGVENDSYEKLIAHEIAHRLHVRILNGNDDAMGPVWFFEGFALHAAGQFGDGSQAVTPTAMRAIVESKERGSYRSYACAMKYLLNVVPLETLVRMAGKKDFSAKLLARLNIK